MPPETAAEDEALAQTLYKLYYEALGAPAWEWEQLQPEERTAWIICGQWVIANFASQDDNEPDHR